MRKSLQTYRSFFAAYCKKMAIALNIVLLMFTACADASPCSGTVNGTCPTGQACYRAANVYGCYNCTNSNLTCPDRQACGLTPGSTTAYSCQPACIPNSSGVCPAGKVCHLSILGGDYQCYTCTGTVSNGTCPSYKTCALTPGSTTAYSCQDTCKDNTSGVCPTVQVCYRSNSSGVPRYSCYTCGSATTNANAATATCPNGQTCALTPGATTYSCQIACSGQTSGICSTVGQACYRSNSAGAPQYNCYTCGSTTTNANVATATCPSGKKCNPPAAGSNAGYTCVDK